MVDDFPPGFTPDVSHVGAYDCGCGDPLPAIEKWVGYIGFEVGVTVCRNCGRATALQIESVGEVTHTTNYTPWDEEGDGEATTDGDTMAEIPTDDDGFTYVVITGDDGPFDRGELLVCAPLPGKGVREVGYPRRKPLKWDCDYEMFGSLPGAVECLREINPLMPRWVPGDSDE